ncbi:AAA family ATPase [Azospirillum largimobile]
MKPYLSQQPKCRFVRCSKLYRGYLHGNVSDAKIEQIIGTVRYFPGIDFATSLQSYDFSMESWRTLARDLRKFPQGIRARKLKNLHIIQTLPTILNEIDFAFRSMCNLLTYIGPSRATGMRYYRLQELAIDAIDPSGSNFAMFIASLSNSQRESFSNMVAGALGYHVNVERIPGHVSIMLNQVNSGHEFNIADMGYGFSQVLPVLAQIWMQRRKKFGSTSKTIAVEQPELHLHPALQARLADAFAKAIYMIIKREGKLQRIRSGLNLLIETHSEQIINRIGELIYEEELSSNDVAIYIFDKEGEDSPTDIKKAGYGSDGRLTNWPFGFFLYKDLP